MAAAAAGPYACGMRWVMLAAGVAMTMQPACTSNKYANAALAAGATVAAAVAIRAIADTCYASCAYGTVCNHDTGLCEGRPEQSPTALDDEALALASEQRATAPVIEEGPPPDEDCGGLCLGSEICVSDAGELVCVPRRGR